MWKSNGRSFCAVTQIVEITVAITELHLISLADPAPVQLAVIKVGLNTTDEEEKNVKKKKNWNKNDCWPSKTRSKQIIGSKDGYLLGHKHTVCKFGG